jgi:hypothetical protein
LLASELISPSALLQFPAFRLGDPALRFLILADHLALQHSHLAFHLLGNHFPVRPSDFIGALPPLSNRLDLKLRQLSRDPTTTAPTLRERRLCALVDLA